VKQPAELAALRNHVVGLLERASAVGDPATRERLLTLVIAGGGFSGVEMCAAMAELFAVAQRQSPVLGQARPRRVLVHAGHALLPQLRPRYRKLAGYAAARLAAYGVEVRLGIRLAAVTAEGALLSDGTAIVSDTVIATVGQGLRPLPGTEGLPRDAANRLLTDDALHVQGESHLWAGGDAAHVVHYRTGEPCPSNALWAIKHGERLGDNIARAIQGKQVRTFRYPGLGQAASLGIGKGAVELYGLQFTGWIGWLMRLGFFLYFMPSRRQALRFLSDWLLLPFGGRDLATVAEGARAAAPGRNRP
jgi:NADH:ubiquinone reductase (H+-translocating)